MTEKNPLILITGATGFVGRAILTALADCPVRLRLLVREENPTTLDFLTQEVEWVLTSDLFSESRFWWEKQCDRVDMVIHLAWYAEPGKYVYSEKNMDCLIGTLKMAQGAAAAGVSHVVGIGTCYEYDLRDETVKGNPLSIHSPLCPDTPYGAAKAAAFLSLKGFFSQTQTNFSWCRLFYLYGKNEDSRRLIPYLHQQLSTNQPALLGSGKQIRDYMDVAAAGQKIADIAFKSQGGIYNVCSGNAITLRALAEKIADTYGRRDCLHFGARPDRADDPACVFGVSNSQ